MQRHVTGGRVWSVTMSLAAIDPLPQVTAQVQVLESRNIVITTGARGELVTSNSSSFVPAEFGGQCWIDSDVGMRDLLILYNVLGKLVILGIDMCPKATAGNLRSIVHVVFLFPIGVVRHWWIRCVSLRYL